MGVDVAIVSVIERGDREGGLFYATASSSSIFVLLCFVGSCALEGVGLLVDLTRGRKWSL